MNTKNSRGDAAPKIVDAAIAIPPALQSLFAAHRAAGTPREVLPFALLTALDHHYVVQQGELRPGASELDRFGYDLIRAMRSVDGQVPADAHDPDQVATAARALKLLGMASRMESAQYGFEALISAIRHQVLGVGAEPATAGAPTPLGRVHSFRTCGAGMSELELVVELPAIETKAHLGIAKIREAGCTQHFLEAPVPEITGYRSATHSVEALSYARAGMVPFGDWYTADGFGRELAAAQIAGLVRRVGKPVSNGLGGVSPVYALTDAGRDWLERVQPEALGTPVPTSPETDEGPAFSP